MAIPRSKFFQTKKNFENKEETDNYIVKMVYELQSMYDDLADGINGNIKSSYGIQKEQWTPILKGSTVTGSFTYVNQTGWVFRQGLLVDAWGDLSWSASGGATGNIYVELPYKVANTTNNPFIGCVQASSVAYGAGNTTLFIDAISDTYRGEIWQSGSGIAISHLPVSATGQFMFHIRYLGVQDER